ncbi:MAG: hypothetical protein ABSB76_11415 [Streptosporangiaceae bacterium]|jgi:hypothetical protein
MNTSYLIYQAERTKTAAEQRAIDRSAGELAASLARRWHALARLSQGHLLRRGPRQPAHRDCASASPARFVTELKSR